MVTIIVIIIAVLLIIIVQYNSMVSLKKKVEQSSSSIEVYLKQRFDLLPNLVETVKAYAKYEKETLEKIIEMRKQYMNNSSDLEEGARLNNECDKVVFLAEKYPELKADAQFLNLQKNLSKLESQLQAARRIYNSNVTIYNTKISVFPNNILAGIFGFKTANLFNINENEAKNINVNLT
ncbi:MAG: LemA family protein [Clostridia bacterium]|nr:LemA family protein [Clostridia bacterium]